MQELELFLLDSQLLPKAESKSGFSFASVSNSRPKQDLDVGPLDCAIFAFQYAKDFCSLGPNKFSFTISDMPSIRHGIKNALESV